MQNEEVQSELKKTIGRRVRRFRGKLSQEKLARNAGISTASVNQIENGKANPTLDVLERLANALGLRVEILTKMAAFRDSKETP